MVGRLGECVDTATVAVSHLVEVVGRPVEETSLIPRYNKSNTILNSSIPSPTIETYTYHAELNI